MPVLPPRPRSAGAVNGPPASPTITGWSLAVMRIHSGVVPWVMETNGGEVNGAKPPGTRFPGTVTIMFCTAHSWPWASIAGPMAQRKPSSQSPSRVKSYQTLT